MREDWVEGENEGGRESLGVDGHLRVFLVWLVCTEVDIYGVVASSIAADDVHCLQCGAPINGARYVQHLSRCMGRNARTRAWNAYVP